MIPAAALLASLQSDCAVASGAPRLLGIRGVRTPLLKYPSSAMVYVRVDAGGGIADINIFKSSGNMQADRAVLTAAQKASYAPATSECQPVSGGLMIYFSNFDAATKAGGDVSGNWCAQAQRLEEVVVADTHASASDLAQAGGQPVISAVRVSLAPDGTAQDATAITLDSSGFDGLDRDALAAAKRTYAAPIAACRSYPVEAIYLPAFF